jgi:hypothetical protein
MSHYDARSGVPKIDPLIQNCRFWKTGDYIAPSAIHLVKSTNGCPQVSDHSKYEFLSGTSYSDVQRQVLVTLTDTIECSAKLINAEPYFKGMIQKDKSICAVGKKGYDTCQVSEQLKFHIDTYAWCRKIWAHCNIAKVNNNLICSWY